MKTEKNFHSADTAKAAALLRDAALELAAGTRDPAEHVRYLTAGSRLRDVLGGRTGRIKILAASPWLTESSGRVRTLVEMIEDELGDDAARFRLAKLLMRALIWNQATPPSRGAVRIGGEMALRRPDEFRKLRDAVGASGNFRA